MEKYSIIAFMLLQVKIKNLGKLTDADIRIGNFTVFAGKNSTGKSYVSKALYSLFNAMNVNHVDAVLKRRLYHRLPQIRKMLSLLHRRGAALKNTNDAIRGLTEAVEQITVRDDADEFDVIGEALPDIRKLLDVLEKDISSLKKKAEKGASNYLRFVWDDEEGEFEKLISDLKHVKSMQPEDWVLEGIEYEIKQNLLQNFQVSKLSYLHKADNKPVHFNVPQMGGDISINNGNIAWNADKKGLHLMQKYSRVLYLESPIFWRLKNALDGVRLRSPMRLRPFMHRERALLLTGVPKYYYDMKDMFDVSYSGEHICPEVVEKLTGDQVLGGRVIVGETGNLFFQSNKGKKYLLRLAATGIANLGMLALLIEQNFLDKDTFLFIDEPEAHLHPAWQIEMAEALFALSQKGVKVVIATHSMNIIKWVDVKAKKEFQRKKGAENHFSLNHFVGDKVEQKDDFFQQIGEIKEDLMEPYQDLFIEGMRE